MRSYPINRIRLLFIIFIALLTYCCNEAQASSRIKKMVPVTAIATDTVSEQKSDIATLASASQKVQHVSFFKKLRYAREVYRLRGRGLPGKGDGLAGILSLIFGVGSFVSLIFTIALLSAAGIAGALFFLAWPLLAIAAIVTGAIGMGKDSNRGKAVGGLILGIAGMLLFLLLIAIAVVIAGSLI